MVRKILHLRRTRGWGPARIADKLGLRSSTVHKVLRREGEPLLCEHDLATRRAIRRQVKRYEHEHPGDLIHVDIKKLGKIPNGGGHRVHGRVIGGRNSRLTTALRTNKHLVIGYGYVHTAVDDHSAWPTARSCPTSRRPPPQPSGGAR